MTALADTFCKSLPKMPLIWDPSRLAPPIACLRKHWYMTARGLRLNGGTNVHLEWGHAYHACCERRDLALISGLSDETATMQAITLAFELSWDFEGDRPRWGKYVDLYQCTDPEYMQGKRNPQAQVLNRDRCKYARKAWEEIPISRKEAINAQGQLYGICAECGHRVELRTKWFPVHAKKTRGNLIRAVALYCDTPGLPPYAFSDKSPATEVQHRVPLPLQSVDGVPYELLVNIDGVSEYEEAPAIRERKTTGLSKLDWRFWMQYEMGPQTDSYDLVGQVFYADGDQPAKMLIEATRVSQGGETEIQRAPITIGDGRRAEWFRELQEVIKDVEDRTVRAREYEDAGLDPTVHFPRRTTACHTKNGTCAFWRLCTAEPEDRETIIASDYHIEHWNPVDAEAISEEEE